MKNSIDINDIVKVGAGFLNNKAFLVGCWPERINLEKLDMGSPTNDILGQLFENRYKAILELRLDLSSLPVQMFGFIPSDKYPADELTSVWKQIIIQIKEELLRLQR